MVLPSVYPDPLPRTVIEGMAYGCQWWPSTSAASARWCGAARPARCPESTTPEALADVMLGHLRPDPRVAREGPAREVVVEAFDARQHARKIPRRSSRPRRRADDDRPAAVRACLHRLFIAAEKLACAGRTRRRPRSSRASWRSSAARL